MIPLAKKLLELGHTVLIGSGNEHISMFREELPGLHYIHFPGFKPRYSRILPQYLCILLKLPSLLVCTVSEHKKLKRIIMEHNIDLVISDNRLGLWNKSIRTVYVTHMPLIPFPGAFRFMEWIGIFMHGWIIRKYSYCLIPDLPGDMNLTGRLSHGIKLPPNVRFIGMLSRFSDLPSDTDRDFYPSPRTTLILSGPEPQKSILRNKITSLQNESGNFIVILEGKPESGNLVSSGGTIVSYSHLRSAEMKKLITGSKLIISRPGYTTIMELISMKCSALLVPTPGQTEQEYLSDYLSARGWFKTTAQRDLKSDRELTSPALPEVNGMITESKTLLEPVLNEVLQYP